MIDIDIDGRIFHISEARATANKVTNTNSYVVISFEHDGGTKEIYMAPRIYAKSKFTESFYLAEKIDTNINLFPIVHGTIEDSPANTMGIFVDRAEQIHRSLCPDKKKLTTKVLINCNHGRSRTGAVTALYLMNHLNISAEDAINVVTRALEARGLPGGIDLKCGFHGSYGDWLRTYKPKKNDKNKENSPKNDSIATNSTPVTRSQKRALLSISKESFFSTSESKKPRFNTRSTRMEMLN